jgi:hypothetical protein
MTTLFVNDSGEANEKQPVKERKNSKQELFNHLTKIRKANIEIIETYKDKAAEGNPTAMTKCVEARSQNDLIENIIVTFLSSFKEKKMIEQKEKNWLFKDCLNIYIDFAIRESKLDPFTGRETISKGLALRKDNFKAMYDIIDFMKGLVDGNEQRVLDGWTMILSEDVWTSFPQYIRNGTAIPQIKMRMLEIVMILKKRNNGTTGKTTKVGDTTIINPNQDASKAESERQSKQDDLVNFAKSWLKGSDY